MIKAIRIFLLVLIISGLGLIYTRDYWVPTVVDQILNFTGQAIAVSYVCNGDKSIAVNYFSAPKTMLSGADKPPIPTGVVSIRLSDGRSLDLGQTISADGARYANPDESFIFWDKGGSVLILENGEEKSFRDCVEK